MIGPAFGGQSWHQAAMNYVMSNAPAPARIRMVDTIAAGMTSGSSSGFLTTDNVHWGVWANREWRSAWVAQAVRDALLDMLL